MNFKVSITNKRNTKKESVLFSKTSSVIQYLEQFKEAPQLLTFQF